MFYTNTVHARERLECDIYKRINTSSAPILYFINLNYLMMCFNNIQKCILYIYVYISTIGSDRLGVQ